MCTMDCLYLCCGLRRVKHMHYGLFILCCALRCVGQELEHILFADHYLFQRLHGPGVIVGDVILYYYIFAQ